MRESHCMVLIDWCDRFDWQMALVWLTYLIGLIDRWHWFDWHMSLVWLTDFIGLIDRCHWFDWHISLGFYWQIPLIWLTDVIGLIDRFNWGFIDRYHWFDWQMSLVWLTDDHLLIAGLKADVTYHVVVEARKMQKYHSMAEGEIIQVFASVSSFIYPVLIHNKCAYNKCTSYPIQDVPALILLYSWCLSSLYFARCCNYYKYNYLHFSLLISLP